MKCDEVGVDGDKPGWTGMISGHSRLAFASGIAAAALAVLLSACSSGSDEQADRTNLNATLGPDSPVFTRREADLFRTVAFSGAEFDIPDAPPPLAIAHKWERAIFARISGDPDHVDLAEMMLREVAGVAGILVVTPDDARLANLLIRVGVSGQEHVDNLIE